MSTKLETGFVLDEIRKTLDAESWEEERNDGGDGQTRSVFLGTVFSLTPSGKFYTPFACSNVTPCPLCKGAGFFPAHPKRRIVKKWKARNDQRMRRIQRMRAAHVDEDTVRAYYTRTHSIALTVECEYCGGLGSREAHLDELWRELAEEEMESIGASLENGEGDPCDLFATEFRDSPDTEEATDEE